ncbi:MAG: PQQ-dependent sugar dehydrogenase [Acidobacteria bacterium]|nr:PQQ-dependent sugar dehydrogenase [Acidobacteriota bacterium]
MSRLGLLLCCVAVVACKKAPSPPAMDEPGATETINGTERIGWDQRAADAVELAAIRYALYADGARTVLTGVSCATAASAAGFSCGAQLPSLSPGTHTLQLASFIDDGGIFESTRSAPLRVEVTPAMTGGAVDTDNRDERSWSSGIVAVTADRVRMRAEVVVDGLERPTDLVFTPDRRLIVSERAGRIRIVRDGHLLPDAAVSIAESLGANGSLLALAVDPQFDRNRHVFAIYTAPARSGEPTFCLVRFREVSDTLGDPAVLLDGIPASPAPRASLRFGADAKLYAAFDDGGDARRAGDLASPNGKILRLNADGTTPDDQAGSTPVYSDGFGAPGGFDWNPRSGTLWVADSDRTGASRLRAIVADAGSASAKRRALVADAYALPSFTTPSSAVFYRGSLFPAFATSLLVASDEGRHLLRIQLDQRAAAKPVAVERLLQDSVGGLRAVAIGPEGAIYFATANAIGRLMPDLN